MTRSGRNQRKILYFLALVLLCLSALGCAQKEQPAERGTPVVSLYSVALPDMTGKTISFQSFQGKIIVLDFFASWCGPCKETAAAVQAIHEQYGKQPDVVVIGVSMDSLSNRDAVRKFVRQHGITFPAVIDDEKIREVTGVYMVPTTLIIDKKGAVQTRIPGVRKDLKEYLAREIERLR